MISLGPTVTYGTDRSSETRLYNFTQFWSPSVRLVRDPLNLGATQFATRERGMVMRHLNETADVPTKIVKVIGDMCG
jgi:hypothetical protein